MRIRTIAVVLIFALAAWLPVMAQQSSAPQPAAPRPQAQADKSACPCCENTMGRSQENSTARSKPCCNDKEMACCQKDTKDNQSAMNCCSGKGGKRCADKKGQSCRGKDAMACNSKDAKSCCAGHSMCSRSNSQS